MRLARLAVYVLVAIFELRRRCVWMDEAESGGEGGVCVCGARGAKKKEANWAIWLCDVGVAEYYGGTVSWWHRLCAIRSRRGGNGDWKREAAGRIPPISWGAARTDGPRRTRARELGWYGRTCPAYEGSQAR